MGAAPELPKVMFFAEGLPLSAQFPSVLQLRFAPPPVQLEACDSRASRAAKMARSVPQRDSDFRVMKRCFGMEDRFAGKLVTSVMAHKTPGSQNEDEIPA
jgi:hypothetical protein